MTESIWEDHLLERKTEGDLKDLLKTMVAFANSVRPGHVAVILIGECDDGSVLGVSNPDNIQKRVRKEADAIYPAIVWRAQVYEKEEMNCVRVEIEFSGNTPHFGGSAWIRRGSESIKAPEEEFQRLIELRLSKVRELQKYTGHEVTVEPDMGFIKATVIGSFPDHPSHAVRFAKNEPVKLTAVNQFYASFEFLCRVDLMSVAEKPTGSNKWSEPLSKLSLAWDFGHNRIRILVAP